MNESEKAELKDRLVSAGFIIRIWGVNKQKMTANSEVDLGMAW